VAIGGLESVLVTFPGFAQNANGAIHPRGAHNQMTYVLDGMPITDQLTGAFWQCAGHWHRAVSGDVHRSYSGGVWHARGGGGECDDTVGIG